MAFLMAEIKSKTDKFIPHSILTKNDESDKKGNGNEEARAKNDNRETAVAEKGTSTLMDDKGGGGAAGKSGFSGFQTALQLSKKSNESHGDDDKVWEKKEVKSANNDKDSKVKARLKLLGLSDEDDEGENFESLENGNDKNDQDLSSETSSSPELDDQDDVIPTHAPNEKSPII